MRCKRHHYERNYLKAFKAQILRNADGAPAGPLEDAFDATYNFEPVFFSLRNARVEGRFRGEVSFTEGRRVVSGEADFIFSDRFKDPGSFVQFATLVRNQVVGALGDDSIREDEIDQTIRDIFEIGGTPYAIQGKWSRGIYVSD